MKDVPSDIPTINRLVNIVAKTSGIDYFGPSGRDLIRNEGITVEYFSSAWMARKNGGQPFLGDTEEIAAMRCYLGNLHC